MRNLMVLGLLLVSSAGCIPTGELGASTGPRSNLVPDMTYIPKAGDRAALYYVDAGGTVAEQIPILKDITAFDKFERANSSDDPEELPNLEAQKFLQYTPPATPVFLVKIYDRTHVGARPAAEVRLLDGNFKGQTWIAPLMCIARLKRPEIVE